jgi:hypothetical protein
VYFLVWPKQVVIPILDIPKATLDSLYEQTPKGILRVSVVEAKNLPESSGQSFGIVCSALTTVTLQIRSRRCTLARRTSLRKSSTLAPTCLTRCTCRATSLTTALPRSARNSLLLPDLTDALLGLQWDQEFEFIVSDPATQSIV